MWWEEFGILVLRVEKERDNLRTVVLTQMNFEKCVFDLYEYPLVDTRINLHDGNNVVKEGCVRGGSSVRPRVTDVFVIRRVVKREVLKFLNTSWNKELDSFGRAAPGIYWFFVMQKTEIQLTNVLKGEWREGIKLRTIFWRTGIFSRASGNFKRGGFLAFEEGRTYWNIRSINFHIPWLPPHWSGKLFMFSFAPTIHGVTKICLFDGACELWWVLMGWCVDLCRIIINM